MPGLLVPGLFPAGGQVRRGSGAAQNRGWGSPYLPQWCQRARPWASGGPRGVHLHHVQSCVPAKGQRWPPPGVPAGPMGSKDE